MTVLVKSAVIVTSPVTWYPLVSDVPFMDHPVNPYVYCALYADGVATIVLPSTVSVSLAMLVVDMVMVESDCTDTDDGLIVPYPSVLGVKLNVFVDVGPASKTKARREPRTPFELDAST